MAPYCAIPRDYLSDTPLLRAMGFLVSQHGQLGAIPPPLFLSVSPLERMRSGGAIPPPLKRGISAILARYPMKTRQNGCDTPLCDTISKGYCVIWGWYLALGRQDRTPRNRVRRVSENALTGCETSKCPAAQGGLPIAVRHFWSRIDRRPNRLLRCFSKCLSPHKKRANDKP